MSFSLIYKTFLSKKTNDLINGILRAEIRTKAIETSDQELMDSLKNKPKNISINNISTCMENPFTIMNYTEKTEIQKLIEKHSEIIQYHGNFIYSTSCGGGKTMSGIYLMYKLQCKTLIISSRNSVNDQWVYQLKKMYPKLKITNLDSLNKSIDYDVYVFTPQYLANKIDSDELDFLKPSLIIYDEIHSLVSDIFSKVLYFPFVNVNNGKYSELPYMISLSATLPLPGSKENKLLRKIFGREFKLHSNITNIPVNIIETRNDCTCIESIRYFMNRINGEEGEKYGIVVKTNETGEFQYKPVEKIKGIVMTYTIDSSIYAALYIRKLWNCNIIIMRSVDESCILIEKDKNLDYAFDKTLTYEKFKNDLYKIGKYCDLDKVINKCQVVVGTLHRLREGFDVQNCVFGIITKYVYSLNSRIQCIGRVRRKSPLEWLNKYPRIVYANSSDPPTNFGLLYNKYKNYRRAKKDAIVTYDFETEKKLFEEENYIYILD